ncbi:MAG: cryptochrome/photolyase family protein [Thermoleophilia bacterium]
MAGHTAWLLAEHLSPANPVLEGARRVLVIESAAAIGRGPHHRQKLLMVLSAMRRCAERLRAEGREVDLRSAPTFAAGVAAHRAEHGDPEVRLLAPLGRRAAALARLPGVRAVDGSLLLTPPEEFDAWAAGRRRLVMEDFYRRQRRRLGVLMDGDAPLGGVWNLDAENRRPPPRDLEPPELAPYPDDAIDAGVRRDLERLAPGAFGAIGPRLWPATPGEARARLDAFVRDALPAFGPYQDAMLGGRRLMWHSGLAAAMNLGLLDPMEAVRAVEDAHRAGAVPLASAEGFVRQVIGWREYVAGLYRLWGGDWDGMNALGADAPLPDLFRGGPTRMRCMADAVGGLGATGYAHHIERLMLFGNLMLLLGVRPSEALEWFTVSFVDGHEWVMAPNVLGMALHADGGRMMTKPYPASGAYVKRMSDHCRGCAYDPATRGGPRACPFTALYWDFLDRHRERWNANPRMRPMLRNLDRLDPAELAAARGRAAELRAAFDA